MAKVPRHSRSITTLLPAFHSDWEGMGLSLWPVPTKFSECKGQTSEAIESHKTSKGAAGTSVLQVCHHVWTDHGASRLLPQPIFIHGEEAAPPPRSSAPLSSSCVKVTNLLARVGDKVDKDQAVVPEGPLGVLLTTREKSLARPGDSGVRPRRCAPRWKWGFECVFLWLILFKKPPKTKPQT